MMNKINMEQVKSMYATNEGNYFSIERYHQLITMIRVYSDLSLSNDTIKFSAILRIKLCYLLMILVCVPMKDIKKFIKLGMMILLLNSIIIQKGR